MTAGIAFCRLFAAFATEKPRLNPCLHKILYEQTEPWLHRGSQNLAGSFSASIGCQFCPRREAEPTAVASNPIPDFDRRSPSTA